MPDKSTLRKKLQERFSEQPHSSSIIWPGSWCPAAIVSRCLRGIWAGSKRQPWCWSYSLMANEGKRCLTWLHSSSSTSPFSAHCPCLYWPRSSCHFPLSLPLLTPTFFQASFGLSFSWALLCLYPLLIRRHFYMRYLFDTFQTLSYPYCLS